MSTHWSAGMDGAEVLVEFRLPHVVVADQVCVVGEFNDWSTTSHPMAREGDAFTARISLTPGRTYRFRYLLDGERWENDWDADAYVPNEFGGDDSVIDLTAAVPGSAAVDGVVEPPSPVREPSSLDADE